MPTSRSISPETWAHVRDALVFYFTRRHGIAHAEDLAQETLAAVLGRDDYEFACEEDFPKVCLAFARRVSWTGYRARQREAGPLDFADATLPPGHHAGADAVEARILLDQVQAIAQQSLRDREWHLILEAAGLPSHPSAALLRAAEPNRFRVYLFRARRKLAALAGR
jgi:DNA-directed RNA polymerase specialized sigma24 family protein